MNLKRFTSFALALILCFALAPVNADALASENDAVKNGYYDSSGQWVEGKLQQTLPEGIHSVNKTATPVADNTYEVTLEVVTKQKVESFTKKSATVLVLDTSKSMNDDSRLKTLKNSAAEFITTYAGKKENTGRYLAVVQFSTGTKVVLNWTDVSTEQGKKSAIDSIQALKANEIKRHTVIMLAVTTDSLAKVLVLCTISVMMCCIKQYWNDCNIGLRQYSRTKKRW